MCSQGPCSNSTLQTVVTDILNGCSTDLASYGLTTNDPTAIVTTVQAAYPAVREIACFKELVSLICPCRRQLIVIAQHFGKLPLCN